MRIVVGLGNPGQEYARTRHNIGFMVVDELAHRAGGPAYRRRFRADVAEAILPPARLVLAKPQTYMNLSGHAVRELIQWYDCPLDQVLIVLDDLDLPFGTIRLRPTGSAGGHNGLTSIIEQLGSTGVPRMRLGIGRGPGTPRSRVLSRFNPAETVLLPELIDRAASGATLWANEGIITAMNRLNVRPGADTSPTPPADERV